VTSSVIAIRRHLHVGEAGGHADCRRIATGASGVPLRNVGVSDSTDDASARGHREPPLIAETDRAIAFMDINPVTEGHALVVPREHASDLLDVPHDDLAACALLSQEIARRATDRLGADGVNLLDCSGADAWQTEFHAHVHVIPRFKNQPARDRSIRLPWNQAPDDPDEIVRIGTRLA
jgi:histidine triad (HIT) family protein